MINTHKIISIVKTPASPLLIDIEAKNINIIHKNVINGIYVILSLIVEINPVSGLGWL